MKKTFLMLLLCFSAIFCSGAEKSDSLKIKEKHKKGWNIGGLPVVAYDTDVGLKYGIILNLFNFGDTLYPKYRHNIYMEWSRTTKGSGINQIIYDSKYLIPKVRLTAEANYLTEKALDFYGFNGYKALYEAGYEDDNDLENYRSRLYYRQERKLLRFRTDFQGPITSEKFRWLLGASVYSVKTDTVDLNKLNEGKNKDDMLPAVNGGLYGKYAYQWGIIPKDQVNGGDAYMLRLGVVIDTRDNEPKANSGVFTDAFFISAPGFLGNKYSFAKLHLTHRQYFTILSPNLNFAYRLGYQSTLWGTTPYYLLPVLFKAGYPEDRFGLGGSKTMRGILRNRVVGEDTFYGNTEFRWVFYRGIHFNQNIYLALNAFSDFGMVPRDYEFNTSKVPEEEMYHFPDVNEKLHTSLGGGFRVALNQNFIVAIDYGRALDKRDGTSGMYINLNWLF